MKEASHTKSSTARNLRVVPELGLVDLGDPGLSGRLPHALAACDALVMASVNDPYPQAPLEAMAVGLPVIATRSGGFPSMVNLDPAHPTGWLVAPDDVDALADALVEAVNRPDELRTRGANALAHAREHLSWSGLVPQFEDAYAAAIERHQEVAPR